MKNTIQLTKLRLDGGTQPRVRIDMDVVRDYAERIKAGDDFPPVDVFHDGAEHWLAEGFHRYHAYKEAGHKVVPCTLRKGTVRDAILFSCGANGHHGLRRTNADKRKAVETLLKDEEWGKNSVKWISETACVSLSFAQDVAKQQQDTAAVSSPKKRTGKDGKTYPSTKPKKNWDGIVRSAPSDSPIASAQDCISAIREAAGNATEAIPYTCKNCGSHEADDDGDCAKCHEPAPPAAPAPEAAPEGGYEPIEAKKHLDKLADLIGKAAREHVEVEKILGKSVELGTVFGHLDSASIALTKFRNAFKRKVK